MFAFRRSIKSPYFVFRINLASTKFTGEQEVLTSTLQMFVFLNVSEGDVQNRFVATRGWCDTKHLGNIENAFFLLFFFPVISIFAFWEGTKNCCLVLYSVAAHVEKMVDSHIFARSS